MRRVVTNLSVICVVYFALQACAPEDAFTIGALPEPVEVSYATPAELLDEMRRLQSQPCGLDCQLAIAGMYSTEYLKGIRAALTFGLSDETSGREVSLMLFGEELSSGDFESMTDQEFFARQLLHRERTAPPEMMLQDYEIISEERISETRVAIVVMRSGLPDFPDYEEEDLMSFIREDGVWKITF